MSSTINHAKRSRRGYAMTKSVLGNISRTNHRRSDGRYSGKTYAVRLGMFKKWLQGRRNADQSAQQTEE